MADAAQLRQVVLNLVLNARDALERGKQGGGKIRVSTGVVELPEESTAANAEPFALSQKSDAARGGGQILLSVEDNGCGMNAETRAHLFQPLFTTKKSGEGTGLGLGIVQRVVAEMGGVITVASAPGSGTRVEVLLRAAQEPGVSAAAPCQISDPRIVSTPK